MTSKETFSNAETAPLNMEKEQTQKKLTTLITSVILSSSLVLANVAQARNNMTEEQLAKARQTASQLNPPVDLDQLLNEADRLGVICEGDLTRRAVIKMCKMDVDNVRLDDEINQSRIRQAKLDEEIASLKEDNTRLEEDNTRLEEDNAKLEVNLRQQVEELSKIAADKLNK